MPIRKVKGGYKWGSKGKVYKNRKDAERQAAAAYASGYVKNQKVLLEDYTQMKTQRTLFPLDLRLQVM